LITGLAINSDATRLLTGSRDATARVWDTATGKEIVALRAPGDEAYWVRDSPMNVDMQMGTPMEWVSFTANGLQVVPSAKWRGIRRWDVRYALLPGKDLVAELCAAHVAGVSAVLLPEEMRFAGYPGGVRGVDVCADSIDELP